MIGRNHVIAIDADRTVWREIGDEIVILDVLTTTYLNLNRSAGTLWKRLGAGATPVELTAELVATFGISEDQAATDVEAFLEALQERSLLSLADAPTKIADVRP